MHKAEHARLSPCQIDAACRVKSPEGARTSKQASKQGSPLLRSGLKPILGIPLAIRDIIYIDSRDYFARCNYMKDEAAVSFCHPATLIICT